MIPFLDLKAPYLELKAEIDEAIARVVSSGWFILGEEVERFESAFADYCGVRHAVGLANGLDALHLALRALDVRAGDEVIVPSNTYIATWLAVSQCGAVPVPVEPDEATHCLDAARVEAAITARTKVILPVHLYGHPTDMDAVLAVAKRHGLRVLEDAAQAHGARWRGRRIGGHGDVVAWSFYPGKNLGAIGDGGAITTNDAALAERIGVLRNYGSRVKYVNDIQGWNSRLDPIQAAVLRVKLAHLDEWNARRSRVAAHYARGLASLPGLVLPREAAGAESAWHLYVVRHRGRDGLQKALAEAGVGTLIHYPIPPHLQKAYANAGYREGSFPLAERLAHEVLSLPMGPHVTDDQVHEVISRVAALA